MLRTYGIRAAIILSAVLWAAHARAYRNLCLQSDRRFYHEELGENYRMTNLQAALGVAQLDRIEEIVARNPVARLGRTRDLYSAISYLCGDGAEWVTGETLRVDGGALTR